MAIIYGNRFLNNVHTKARRGVPKQGTMLYYLSIILRGLAFPVVVAVSEGRTLLGYHVGGWPSLWLGSLGGWLGGTHSVTLFIAVVVLGRTTLPALSTVAVPI